MVSSFAQAIRDNLQYAAGYAQGRAFWLPRSWSSLYGQVVAKGSSALMLPLPLFSFLAVPFVGGSTATVNLAFFFLTWSALVWSHTELSLELSGTFIIRILFFLLPALGFLAFDTALPNVSRRAKARGERQLPSRHGRNRLLVIAVVAVCNVLLGVAVQAALEFLLTQVLHVRSMLAVNVIVPLPWTIAKHIAQGLALKGVLQYCLHRFILHKYPTILRTWHSDWQHNVEHPFSLIAAYDHPVNHLLAKWLPTMLPAYMSRWHVLTWYLFLIIISLEDLFVFSGYAVLPSAIMLPGMARRTEAHFDSVRQKSTDVGNFGHLGVLDVLLGTACKHEETFIDDIQNEAEKRQLQERIEAAVQAAVAGMNNNQPGNGPEDDQARDVVERSDVEVTARNETGDGGVDDDGPEEDLADRHSKTAPRRSGRRKEAKG